MTEPIEKWREEFIELFPIAKNTKYYAEHGFMDHDTNLSWHGFKLAKRSQPVVELPEPYMEYGYDEEPIEYWTRRQIDDAGINYRIKGE